MIEAAISFPLEIFLHRRELAQSFDDSPSLGLNFEELSIVARSAEYCEGFLVLPVNVFRFSFASLALVVEIDRSAHDIESWLKSDSSAERVIASDFRRLVEIINANAWCGRLHRLFGDKKISFVRRAERRVDFLHHDRCFASLSLSSIHTTRVDRDVQEAWRFGRKRVRRSDLDDFLLRLVFGLFRLGSFFREMLFEELSHVRVDGLVIGEEINLPLRLAAETQIIVAPDARQTHVLEVHLVASLDDQLELLSLLALENSQPLRLLLVKHGSAVYFHDCSLTFTFKETFN